MSGPTPVAPVIARIGEIQSQLGAVGAGPTAAASGGAALAGSGAAAPSGASPFASALAAAAGSGRGASAGTMPSSWTIPWAPGMAPAPVRTRTATAGATWPSVAAGAAQRASTGGDVVWPLRGTITQDFGPTTLSLEPPATVNGHRYAHYHDGLDIAAAQGTPVRSMAAGTVEFAGRYPDGAVVVRVRHADGSVALYAHLEPNLDVKTGDSVAAGETVGHVGMTGRTTGPHLHLELTVDGHNVDPAPVLRDGSLPGTIVASETATATGSTATRATAGTGSSAATGSTAGGWSAASPLAAANGGLTPAALERFDAIAASIPHHAELRDAAVRAGIDPLLLASLVKAESGFRANAVSSAGALGLCQLMPATAKSLGLKDPFDAVQNLRAGARYFANNLRIYGRTDLALAAYHDGKGAVAAADGVPDYPITHRYIDRILSYWTHYREAAA